MRETEKGGMAFPFQVTTFRVNKLDTSDAALTASLRLALGELGASLGPRGVLVRERWEYFPHFTTQQVVRQRLPWRIWALQARPRPPPAQLHTLHSDGRLLSCVCGGAAVQGQRRTWFVGSCTCFETIADVVDYNLQLVNQMLCAP